MKRTIKFRGIDIDTGEFVYGDFGRAANTDEPIIYFIDDERNWAAQLSTKIQSRNSSVTTKTVAKSTKATYSSTNSNKSTPPKFTTDPKRFTRSNLRRRNHEPHN